MRHKLKAKIMLEVEYDIDDLTYQAFDTEKFGFENDDGETPKVLTNINDIAEDLKAYITEEFDEAMESARDYHVKEVSIH